MSAETPIFDVCVIGSGPAGGVLSKELAERGAKVALVEAGRQMSPEDFHFHSWPYDFPKRSLEGVEEDWPISYQELAPYYSHVERMIGVCGSRENLDILPDGEFLPPIKFRCSEEIVKRACDKMGIPMIPTRKAVLTAPYDDRPPCHYCGHCMEGCDAGAIFTVPNSMLPKAQRTGNFTLLPNRVAREILTDTDGRARAVSVIDTTTRREEE